MSPNLNRPRHVNAAGWSLHPRSWYTVFLQSSRCPHPHGERHARERWRGTSLRSNTSKSLHIAHLNDPSSSYHQDEWNSFCGVGPSKTNSEDDITIPSGKGKGKGERKLYNRVKFLHEWMDYMNGWMDGLIWN